MPDWLQVPRGEEETETEEYGISSFVYRSRRPFHPKRFNELLENDMEDGVFRGILRSKGLIWIASRHDWAYDWSQAGCSIRMNPVGYWWAAAPRESWPEDEEAVAAIHSRFAGEYGDRHQELVIIGQQLDREKIETLFNACLLTDQEWNAGPTAWLQMDDPLPPIEMESETDEVAD